MGGQYILLTLFPVIWLVLGVVCAIVAYQESEAFKRAHGAPPAGLDSVVWAVLAFFFTLPVAIILFVLRRTAKPVRWSASNLSMDADSRSWRTSDQESGQWRMPYGAVPYEPSASGELPGPGASDGAPGTPRPPGWYVEPGDTSQRRYWDGSRWTFPAALGPAADQPLPPFRRAR
jgi:Protein of unknown function (DUF2510)